MSAERTGLNRSGLNEVHEAAESGEQGAHRFESVEGATRRLMLDDARRGGGGPERLSGVDVDEHLRWIRADEARGLGHAHVEHAGTDPKLLERRAATGVNARGEQQRAPVNATTFTSERALVAGESAAWASAETKRTELERRYRATVEAEQLGEPLPPDAIRADQMRFRAEIPIREALGPNWREHVYGRSRASDGKAETEFGPSSTVYAEWRLGPDGEWHLFTCYPKAK